jgi:DNA-binding LacI/PurR family transcriptional regulator
MPRPSYGAVTLQDVARRAGVSRATASRVLAGSAAVSPEARERVRRAAGELHYLPNPQARALATGSGTRVVIGVVSPHPTMLFDAYVGRVAAAAAHTCAPLGLGVSLHWLPLDGAAPLRVLAEDRSVRGVVLLNTTETLLAAIPQALLGRVVSIGIGSAEVPSIDVDNGAGAAAIVRHLYGSGRRRIVFVTGPRWMPCIRRPLRAYSRIMQEVGLPALTVTGDFTAASGRAAAELVLRRWPATDAIFAICDETALGVLAALRERGVDVPGDVAVVGFDDIPFAALGSPPLTTSSHPVERIAEAATRAVVEPTRTRHPDRAFASELVLRRSA